MADNSVREALVSDHAEIYDTAQARRYFAKFGRIGGYLARIAAEFEKEGRFSRGETRILAAYLNGVIGTFSALSHKYLMSGLAEGAPRLTIDRHESGFPVVQELMMMAVDAQQAERHLSGMASAAELRDRMIRTILGERKVPVQLQFALSQRLYYEAVRAGGLFHARNDPEAQWLGQNGDRRRYLIHWAVWDSGLNLPVVYLLEMEDTGRRPLPEDAWRWPGIQQKLLAQSVGGLKLVTMATGFDKDFEDACPKRLRRITLGPMYSSGFTLQSGPISHVLEDARASEGEDWALVWTLEDLISDREELVKDGWFSTRPGQIWRLAPVIGADTGTTVTERMIVLPERPYQVLVEQDPPGLRGIRKFVVGAGGRLIPG
ncbi:hypothetical protein [Rhodobacter sp. 24-YEA-8]|uniref:hypothetical protein n=1 Tax=Rhodobacter sp. 24-YEA-8 TaxID=1884310 RepID=UPI00089C9303|nr:hypothetical protein [Rhodobacter sp. 24-YEA-8]SEB50254.1 hypothetical protein SAMN05519105_0540 [Rhodobacter sp. 24-YEA-8]